MTGCPGPPGRTREYIPPGAVSTGLRRSSATSPCSNCYPLEGAQPVITSHPQGPVYSPSLPDSKELLPNRSVPEGPFSSKTPCETKFCRHCTRTQLPLRPFCFPRFCVTCPPTPPVHKLKYPVFSQGSQPKTVGKSGLSKYAINVLQTIKSLNCFPLHHTK